MEENRAMTVSSWSSTSSASGVTCAPFTAKSAQRVVVVPGLIGLWAGFRISDRIDQATFRKATLWVLLIAGLNLLRKALT